MKPTTKNSTYCLSPRGLFDLSAPQSEIVDECSRQRHHRCSLLLIFVTLLNKSQATDSAIRSSAIWTVSRP